MYLEQCQLLLLTEAALGPYVTVQIQGKPTTNHLLQQRWLCLLGAS